ncbi:phospholipase D family protein [Bdellovibrio sp. HCB185ZH]|uniref:phospholipase D family protein n=1 Tax=Bdellovibrio sp. HCB185ZH TaxID=3394235 RepID=UPI0039A75176
MKSRSYFAILTLAFLLCSCATLPKEVQRNPSSTLDPDPTTVLSKRVKEKLQGKHNLSGFHPLFSGEDAFVARIASIRAAERSLDMQYYIWNNDLTGNIMTAETMKAADRGVRVRILLDDLNLGQYEKALRIMSSHPNIQVRMVNPFANRSFRFFDITRLSEVNRRMHNKVFVADSEIAIVGGRNIGNEYFWASDGINFGDLDLWAIGPVVSGLSKEFDTYWNSEIAYPIASLTPFQTVTEEDLKQFRAKLDEAYLKALDTPYAKGLRNDKLIADFTSGNIEKYWGEAHVVYDTPAKFKEEAKDQVDNLQSQLQPYMNGSKEEIMMISPYFVPGDQGVGNLSDKVKKGVQVTVLTNSLASSDVSSVFAGYKGYRKDLIRSGVELYELRPRFHKDLIKQKKSLGSSGSHAGLHGKTLVFDKKYIFVGSMNLDPRSVHINTEMGVVVESEEMAGKFSKRFKENLPEIAYKLGLDIDGDLQWTTYDDGQKNTLTSEPESSWWQRVKASFMSLFIPESYL